MEDSIKEIRRKLGLTQAALALKMGVSEPTIRNWECGRNAPPKAARQVLMQLARTQPASISQTATAREGSSIVQSGYAPCEAQSLDAAKLLDIVNKQQDTINGLVALLKMLNSSD